MTVLGYDSTVSVSIEEMLMLTKAVRRGLKTPLLIGDMPFGSYESSDEKAIESALRFVKEAGCDAVKLEGGNSTSVSRARAIIEAGIPVMGHVGLTPQSATALGGYKAQGRTAEAALRIAHEALALQAAGCFSIVFEAIPSEVAGDIAARIKIPVVGIGAGGRDEIDGQVLVFHDLLGIREGRGPRFVQRYSELLDEMVAGVAAFAGDVRERRYPAPEHGYSIESDELAAFRKSFTPR
jgi:3-methyl-2-oxobutanoate hydroxymethyltransferase